MEKDTLISLIRRVDAEDADAIAALESAGILAFNVIENAGRFPAYTLANADLSGADLSGLRMVLSRFDGADLSGANLTNAVLVGSSFVGADLSGAWLQGALAVDADFRDTQLDRAEFCGTNCANAVFSGADCSGAKWTGATLVDCNFTGIEGLDPITFADALRLHGTALPGGRYDGRFTLKGDMDDMAASGVNFNKLEQIADFFGVTTLQFIAGQGWAREELPKLLRKRGFAAAAE